MGQDIKIFMFDDKEGKAAGVEATHTGVALAFDTWSGTIDLGDRNYDALAAFLAPFLSVGKGKHKPPRPRGRRPNEFYVQLREWLKAEHGIELVPNDEGKYEYPAKLREQFDKEVWQQ